MNTDITFEKKMLVSTEPTLPSNIFFLFENYFESSYSPIIEKLSTLPFFPELKYKVDDIKSNKYKPILRDIISRNERRFCAKINSSAIFSNLNVCDIILLSYSTINNKNYINGFATLRINDSSNYIIIDYLCGDLQFGGIGSNLVTFIKLFTINVFGENNIIILNSIDSTTTQNFYRTQFFYKITDEVKRNGHELIGDVPTILNEKYNYIWKYNSENLEEKYVFDNFILPFTIKKVSSSKYAYGSVEPELIEVYNVLKPYARNSSPILYEKGGKKIKKSKRNNKSKNKRVKKVYNKSKRNNNSKRIQKSKK
jgi:hypothetical protein